MVWARDRKSTGVEDEGRGEREEEEEREILRTQDTYIIISIAGNKK